ncbi:Gfo/Idh/MocA family oxidoreductase [Magnetovibrio sp.]|uniref:Gfo/Idh/MocA family protein n=1 Tax=Magnetovibrio sp. TaxID=2024836 RepID=UPI002F949B7C
MSSDVLNAIIIGCGRIGGGDKTFSHAAAYSAHAGYRLIGCVERNDETRTHFMDQWKVNQGFSSIEELIESNIVFDVASICTPTPFHAEALTKLLDTNVRAVFCEKPLTDDLGQAQALTAAYAHRNIALAVNYHRRWDSSMQTLKRELSDGEWGRVLSISAHYMKGLFNSGSHMLDLISALVGPLRPVSAIRSCDGFGPNDPTIDAVLKTPDQTIVHLMGIEAHAHFMFEVTIVTERGVIAIEDAGFRIRTRRVQDDPMFANDRNLDEGQFTSTAQDNAFAAAVDNIRNAVLHAEPIKCDGETALQTQVLCTTLLDMSTRAQA